MNSSGQRSRLAAVGLLLVLVATVGGGMTWAVLSAHRHYDAALADGHDQLARFQRLERMRPGIEAALADLRGRDSAGHYLRGATQTLAAAELQTIVTQLIEANGGRTQSSQVQTADKDVKPGEPIKAGITVQLAASPAALLSVIHAIEAHTPFLFIDQLTVRAIPNRSPRPGASTPNDLDIRMTVSGYAPHTDGNKS